MKKVECINVRESIPDQISIGEIYWIDEDSMYTDNDSDTYVDVYTDESKSELIGRMLLSHFDEIDDIFGDDYIRELNTAYWAEREEFKQSIHPSQILERVKSILTEMGNNNEIIFMDYNIEGPNVKVYTSQSKNIPFGVFNYEENMFL